MASSTLVLRSTGSRMLFGTKALWLSVSLVAFFLVGPSIVLGEESKKLTATESHALPLPEKMPPKSSAPSSDTTESASPRKTWVDDVDAIFGTWLVKPLETVLFFDFGTKALLGTSVPFVVIWLLLGGVYLTLRMAFINLRGFYHAIELIRGTYDEKDDQGDVSHFQALASALSGTVGLGNIAGVAIAIGQGGPGATFWMILCGLLGMTSKFSECTLAVMYRRTDEEGLVLGGPMIYLRDGLARMGLGPVGSVLAIVFTFLCIGGSLGGGNSYQVVQSLNALQAEDTFAFLRPGQYPWIYGVAMVILVGAVIIGGIKSIGNFAGRVVPFMCVAYMLVCVSILMLNASQIPSAVLEIFRGAFTPEGLYGGFLGVMVLGIKRACFSNEAGAGSAAIAHAAARTKEPVSEGMVALLEPFIDTVIVCTLTALTIIVTGVYRQPEVLQLAQDNKGSMVTLAAFTQNSSFEWFKYILYLAVFLFAYSTCVSWSYYGERCCVALFGNKSSLPYKCLFLSFTFLGSVVSPTNILDFSDMMILSMAIPNLIGVFLLSNRIRAELDRYWARYKSGELLPKHE